MTQRHAFTGRREGAPKRSLSRLARDYFPSIVKNGIVIAMTQTEIKMGRPTKRTEEITNQIAEALAIGLTDQEACDLVEIDRSTMFDWQQIPEFADAIKSAKAKRKMIRLKRIEEGESGWVGAAWILERHDPENWARADHKILLRETTINNTQVNHLGPAESAYVARLLQELPKDILPKELSNGQ